MLDKIKKTLADIPLKNRIIVGVSGGADSLALAHILARLGFDVIIAHLNHCLRGKESDLDEKFTLEFATKSQIDFVSKKICLPKKGNLEEKARKARYAFLEETRRQKNADFITVAHHRDDQIETILMHIYRGSGLRGLCGMPFQNGNIIRPFLNVPKKEILDYLKKENISCRTDSSNFDTKFLRNHFRHNVIPALKKKRPKLEKDILELSELAKKRLKSSMESATKFQIHYEGNGMTPAQDPSSPTASQDDIQGMTNGYFNRKEFLALPDEAQSEVIFRIAGYRDIYSKNIDEIKALIRDSITGKRKKIGNTEFMNQYEKVIFGNIICLWNLQLSRKLKKGKNKWGKWTITNGSDENLWARQWKEGDRFRPYGMKGTKKLSDLFTDAKIPRQERSMIPIITDSDDNILFVGNMRVSKEGQRCREAIKINHN